MNHYMRRLFTILMATCGIVLSTVSCRYDDTSIKSDITNLQDRVKKLEDQVKNVNTSISNLKELVNALDQKVKIESVEQTVDGWLIIFSSGKTVTVTNAVCLNVSVRKDTDGKYYWTLDGDWLKDEKGEKVPASGVDAIAPKLKIEGDYWYISYDGGAIWTQLGLAKGEPGTPGDSLFQSVSGDESFWYFTLANGDIISIPRGVHGAKAIIAIPDYPDGSLIVSDTEFSLRFKVLPEDAAEGLASESTNIFKLSIVYTYPRTKAKPGEETQLPIKEIEGHNGKLTLTVDGSPLDADFIKGTLGASACLSIVYKENVLTSGYFPLYNPYNGHEYVDMGEVTIGGKSVNLKWATCNVGAENPWDYGDYFDWGGIRPYYQEGHSQDNPCSDWIDGKDGYNWGTYTFMLTGQSDWKYITKYTSADGKTSLADDNYVDDAARQIWGGTWRIPTDEEWTALLDDTYYTWEWTADYLGDGSNHAGRIVTRKNVSGTDPCAGHSIFLPAAGHRYIVFLSLAGSNGCYWSSSISDYSGNAWVVVFNGDGVNRRSDGYRYEGQSIRPII